MCYGVNGEVYNRPILHGILFGANYSCNVCFRLIGVRGPPGGGAHGEGWDDGSRRLPAITSSVGREGIPRLYSSLLSLVLCNGAMSASVQHHNVDEWGRGLEALK